MLRHSYAVYAPRQIIQSWMSRHNATFSFVSGAASCKSPQKKNRRITPAAHSHVISARMPLSEVEPVADRQLDDTVALAEVAHLDGATQSLNVLVDFCYANVVACVYDEILNLVACANWDA